MGMKELIDNINDDKFADAREELSDFVQTDIGNRVTAKREELGLTIPVVEASDGEGEED